MESNNKSIELAIVIVTRNMAHGLRETIASALDLADPRVRVYVVDGASSDGSVDYLKSLAGRPVSWISEADRGIYDAMNKGWRMAPAESYVLYMGSGDKVVSLPSSESIRAAEQAGIRIFIGQCMIGPLVFESNWDERIYIGNCAHHQTLLIQKALHPEPPFDDTMKVYADWDFNLRLFKRGLRAQYDSDFKSYADPSGVSAALRLREIWRVAVRHGGLMNGIRSLKVNARLKLKKAIRR